MHVILKRRELSIDIDSDNSGDTFIHQGHDLILIWTSEIPKLIKILEEIYADADIEVTQEKKYISDDVDDIKRFIESERWNERK